MAKCLRSRGKRAASIETYLALRPTESNAKLQEVIQRSNYGSLKNPFKYKKTGICIEVDYSADQRVEIPNQLDLQDIPK